MSRKSVWLCGVLLLTAAMAGVALAQTTGKIRGKVFDKETGEALVGANVIIETTTMGAVAGVDGEFIILNVPPGTYVLRSTYVGYKAQIIRNIRVTIGLTTEVDFRLESEAVQGPAIEIIAQAPLINKNATNTINVTKAENIERLPVRTVADVFSLSAGVVQQGGNLYVRGGRSEETAYYMDGVLINNPLSGNLSLNIINNAVEEVQAQIGGMTAQYGNAMSGIVSTTTKIGGPKYNAAIELITDQLGNDTKKFLGTYSYGLSEYVATVSGPVVPGNDKIRFFLAGQRIFNRSGTSFLDGISFPYIDSTQIVGADFVVVDENAIQGGVVSATPGSTGNRGYLANLLNSSKYNGSRALGGVSRDSWGFQGNVYFDFGSFNLKIGGTYNTLTSIGGYGRGLDIISVTANNTRGGTTDSWDASGYAKVTAILNPETFISVQGNYYTSGFEQGDQIWMDQIENYGNPNLPENAVLVGPSRNPQSYNVWSFGGNWPGVVGTTYSKQARSNVGGRVDFTHQFGRIWEFTAGGEYTYYTLRNYTIGALNLYLLRLQNPGASDWLIYTKANVGFYGYDIYGNEFDGGTFTDNTGRTVDLSPDGPRHPTFGGFYIQNKFEFSDLVINFGLRYDMIDPGYKKFKDLQRVTLDTFEGTPVVADSSLVDQDVSTQLSPRVGFSFPVSDRTVFHATYGRFMQQGRLNDLYDPRTTAGRFFAGGFARQFPTPNLKPERTTDYEVGFRQQLGDVASFDLTFFYKDIKDLHVIRVIFPEPGAETGAWFANINGDYGTSKGLSFVFQMRRTSRVAMNGSYTLSSSMATGSASGTHFDIAWQDNSYNGQPYFPVIPSFTDFDRTHVGNLNIDYRFDKDDGGPVLERMGLNLLLTFSSGIRWTKSVVDGAFGFSSTNAPQAFENLNSSSGPWIYQLDVKLDKTFSVFNTVDLNLYVWVTNLLNRRNVYGVYTGTGQQNNDGWLGTPDGQAWASRNGADAVTMYNYLQDNLGFLGTPRILRVGARITL